MKQILSLLKKNLVSSVGNSDAMTQAAKLAVRYKGVVVQSAVKYFNQNSLKSAAEARKEIQKKFSFLKYTSKSMNPRK